MENTHIVGRFDKDLAKIKSRVLEMGALVNRQIGAATTALVDLDTDEVAKIVAGDHKINRMNTTIHARAERLIALRQPMALDLREAMSPINIAGELERIGDHAKSTAKRVKKIQKGAMPDAFLEMIDQMSTIIQEQLKDVLVAYENADIELAAKVSARDREVDALNQSVFSRSAKTLSGSGSDPETLLHVVLIARNFERAGDHIVNIARHVHQIVTGVDLKSANGADND